MDTTEVPISKLSYLFSESELEQRCASFKLVANPNRLSILLLLLGGEHAVSEIESSLSIKQPNLSHELRKLREYGLVTTRRQSKVVFYSLLHDGIGHIINDISAVMTQFTASDSSTETQVTALPAAKKPTRAGDECGHFSVVHHAASTY